jgi:hypothetical protein
MPILDMQKRGRELGRIRIGATVAYTRNDGSTGTRPTKLDTFRFTTPSEYAARKVAELFGGECRPWTPDGRPREEWEVVTDRRELPVLIPAGHPLTQWYELWSAAGCQRRCDGEKMILPKEQPCICPVEISDRMTAAALNPPDACKPTTRLSVMIPDVPDLGVWLLRSSGYNAAMELAGAADLLHKAAQADVALPAVLRLDQRSKTANGRTNRWSVPVLELGITLRELVDGTYQREGFALPPAPSDAKALEAGPSAHAAPPDRSHPPAPPAPDGPVWREQEPDDDGAVDAEIVEDAQDIANHVLECETKADVQALMDRARDARLNPQSVVTHPGTNARLALKALLDQRWHELPTHPDEQR